MDGDRLREAVRRIVMATIEECAQQEGFDSFAMSDWSPRISHLIENGIIYLGAEVERGPVS